MKICVYGAASSLIDKRYIEIVEGLCKRLAKDGHELVYGGGASGLMGAAARGFKSEGRKITGIVPHFFVKDTVETLYNECELLYTPDMGTRKTIMEDLADAFIVVPGGIGTFDEFFQILTLKQLKQLNKPIALFNINGYYYSIQALMHNGYEEGFIKDNALGLYECFDENEIDELIQYVEAPAKSMEDVSVSDLKFT